MELLVNVKGVNKFFKGKGKKPDVLAVDSIDLKIMKNEFITILGPSALCRHMLEEAKHYEILSRVHEKHGYDAPVATSEVNKGWEKVHWQALDKDATCIIAVWNCSETSTIETHDIVIENCRRIGLNDLAKCYETIKKDENFHVGLGETIVEKFMVTEQQIQIATEGIRSFRDEMLKFYNDIYDAKPQVI